MAKLVAHMRLIAGALALAFIVAISAPVSAQQPSMVNPTADAVKEQQLLQQLKSIQGRGTIPDVRSYTIEHPVGRDWQHFHSVTLRWIGGIAIRRHVGDPRDLLPVARNGDAQERTFGAHDRSLQRVRTLRALDDGDLLHHPGRSLASTLPSGGRSLSPRSARKHSRPGPNGRNTRTTI